MSRTTPLALESLPFEDGRNVVVKGLALIVWGALVTPDPLLDPWQMTFPKVDEHELKPFAEPVEIEVWKIDADELLNPFD